MGKAPWATLPLLSQACTEGHWEVIGQVLKIDYSTKGVEKARFARLAVKIDLTKPLVSKIRLDGVTQFVEYERLPSIFYQCGKYGDCTIYLHIFAWPNSLN